MSPDALPTGAAFRLGTERGNPPNGWREAVLLPGGTRVYAPHGLQQPGSFQHFTLYEVDGLRPVGPSVLAECAPGGGLGATAAVSVDGRRLATVGVKALEVHDLGTGKRLFRVPRPERGAPTMSLSADGKRVAIGGAGTCAVWDVDAGAEVARVTVLQNDSASVVLSPDGKTLITSRQVWDVDSKAELARPQWPDGRTIRFSPDSKTAAVVVYSSAQLLIVEPRTGKTRHTIDLKEIGTGPVAFAPDGATVALVTDAATRWDVGTGRRLGTVPRPAGLPDEVKASGAAFDAAGRLVAVGTRDLAAYCWDALGGAMLTPVGGGHAGPVRTVAFAANGQEIRTAGADGAVYRWAAAEGKPLGRIPVHKANVPGPFDVRLSRDGRCVVNETAVYAADGPAPPVSFRPPLTTSEFAKASFPAPDGAHVAVIAVAPGTSVRCVVFDVAAARAVFEAPLPARLSRAAGAVGKSPKRLVTAHSTEFVNNRSDVVVTGWDAGKKLGEFTIPNGGVVNGLVLLDDRHAVVSTGMGQVVLINVETGTQTRDFADPTRLSCTALTLSPDGKLLAVAQSGRRPIAKYGFAVRVYDVATGTVRHTVTSRSGLLNDFPFLYNNTPSPETMAFSPDGARLAVPALTSVLVWDLAKIGPDGETR